MSPVFPYMKTILAKKGNEYANTSAATVPILIDEMNRKDMFRKGQKLIMAGFGAGLTWAASLFEW